VGAVVVNHEAVVGTGFHQAVGEPHAEVHALDAAGPEAHGATLYVNLEPCNHTGRTPPCTLKILAAGIQRVVIGMRDPNPAVAGGGADFLKRQGVEVVLGVCEAEAVELNEVFVKFVRTRRPFVIAKCAATLDGRIATRTGDSRWITGDASRSYVHQLRHAADAILVGVGTIEADDPLLTTRLTDRKTKDPIRIILDTRLRIKPTARVLNSPSNAGTLLIAGRGVPEIAKARLTQARVKVIETDTRDGKIDLQALTHQLGGLGISSILIEGGSQVLGSAFRAGIVDKVCFFFGPKILGGDDGVPVCSGAGPAALQDCVHLSRIRTVRFDQDVLIEGYVTGRS
jgi:diaminohydroxyphosphoribosylaminopyrimidine deaminase/5-amino-6-(5-phosphoribosylamino)uracil reductase